MMTVTSEYCRISSQQTYFVLELYHTDKQKPNIRIFFQFPFRDIHWQLESKLDGSSHSMKTAKHITFPYLEAVFNSTQLNSKLYVQNE